MGANFFIKSRKLVKPKLPLQRISTAVTTAGVREACRTLSSEDANGILEHPI